MSRDPIALILVLFLALLACACGSSEEEVEETTPQSVIDCQAACDKIMRCDNAANVTAELLASCKEKCENPSTPSQLIADAVDIECHKQHELCEDFMTCREEARGASNEDPWCRAWCDRCAQCYADQENFGEGMCQDATLDDQEACMRKCESHMATVTDSCQTLFDLFDPSEATCDELDHGNPFDSGC